jgi:two-component system sensor histidine kinase AlgZ
MPIDALVPPLLLQPLIENAVYHGIEPQAGGGEVQIEILVADRQLVMQLTNPYNPAGNHVAGNRMAIANIRERLQLHFDAEASMKSDVADATYQVTIRMPYITAPT